MAHHCRGRDFFRAFTICSAPPNNWGIVVCYGRWALHVRPQRTLALKQKTPPSCSCYTHPSRPANTT